MSSWLLSQCASVRLRPLKVISTRPLCSLQPWLPDATASTPAMDFCLKTADFADACAAAGLTFIGPSGDTIRKAGSKSAARDLMRAAGVPVTPGSDGPVSSVEEALAAAESVGYPVLLKASAAGGGRGIRRCDNAQILPGRLRGGQGGSQGLLRRRRDVSGEAGSGSPAY